MLKKLLVVLGICLFSIFLGCKKDNPTAPEPDFTGCKLTSISANTGLIKPKTSVYFYYNNQLFSQHTIDTSGKTDTSSYFKFKFNGHQLKEKGEVVNGNYIILRSFEYDNKSRLSLIKLFDQGNINNFSAFRFYYNDSDRCIYFLVGRVNIVGNNSTSEPFDSVAFSNFTSHGYPRRITYYHFRQGEFTYLTQRNFEYDPYGNIIKHSAGADTNEYLMYEYEYDLRTPYNLEWTDLNKVILLSEYENHIINPTGLLPDIAVDKYPKTKITHYDYQRVPQRSFIKSVFDSENRCIEELITPELAHKASVLNTYTYTCK
ncbi:MAG TPA: hypothetical protein VEC12_07005 [Bacteroidia bacterium]|nr:hypothetical protein [Bacteroidia bacterium]